MNRIGASILAFSCLAITAQAGTVLNPGDAAFLPTEEIDTNEYDFIESIFRDFSITNNLNQVSATGQVQTAMYRSNVDNTLLFGFVIYNDAGSADALVRGTSTGWTGWDTEVFQDVNNIVGPQLATSANRTASGETVGFNFTDSNLGGQGLLNPGDSSEIMLIKTNATDYGVGTFNVIDGGVDTVESFAPVPEPATLAFLGLGAAALIKRRRKA